MAKMNPEHIKALLELINHSPYFELLAMRVCALNIGYSRVEVELSNQHMNPFGAIHGGVYSSIIDTAAYWSAYCEVDEHVGFTSIDVSVNNLSMINSGKIIVEGKSIKVGRSLCVTEAVAKDSGGKLLAQGTSKLMILHGKQSVHDAIKAMGHKELPPKFID
ncbi:MAG: PaaI family thioesterase [Clostridiales bacterium]|nr:PaaI family thioesterase [Clostridiales bacterium]